MKKTLLSALIAMALLSLETRADWFIKDGSVVTFVSIKNDVVGELNKFEGITGTVSAEGAIDVWIDLDSVETFIEIRNERMKTLLFRTGLFPRAHITGQLDSADLKIALSGIGALLNLDLKIDLHGKAVSKSVTIRLDHTEDQISVVTTQPILLNAADFGLESGVAALQEIAGLDSISRVIPVSVNLRFSS